MRKYFTFLLILLLPLQSAISQEKPVAGLFLLTCGPGTETYSIYGHSALRIVIPEKNTDMVYNWGVFDFSTSHFAWKFAKGRLTYSLGVSSYERFLKEYRNEGRWVVSQRLNIDNNDIAEIFRLIDENLKPENISYKYDFFYDDCSTRIRDLLENSLGDDLIYPPEKPRRDLITFRALLGQYERGYPWLQAGIDLLVGSPADKKAGFRDRMFLPIELKDGLSESLVRKDGKMIPLLADPSLVVDFPGTEAKENFLTSPLLVLSAILIILIILAGTVRNRRTGNIIDIILFSILSLLSLILVFFNFFSEHQQTRWNLNIIWLSPFIIFCLYSLIFNKDLRLWFRIVFYLTASFLVSLVILPQEINPAMLPLIFILLLRSSARASFGWNPFSAPYLT